MPIGLDECREYLREAEEERDRLCAELEHQTNRAEAFASRLKVADAEIERLLREVEGVMHALSMCDVCREESVRDAVRDLRAIVREGRKKHEITDGRKC